MQTKIDRKRERGKLETQAMEIRWERQATKTLKGGLSPPLSSTQGTTTYFVPPINNEITKVSPSIPL